MIPIHGSNSIRDIDCLYFSRVMCARDTRIIAQRWQLFRPLLLARGCTFGPLFHDGRAARDGVTSTIARLARTSTSGEDVHVSGRLHRRHKRPRSITHSTQSRRAASALPARTWQATAMHRDALALRDEEL